MMMLRPRSEVAAERYRFTDPQGQGSSVDYYTGKEHLKLKTPEPQLGVLHPVAFQVMQDADTALQPHFHLADQFQVFIAGGGTMGGKTIAPLSVHYASAHTPYGPLYAGAQTLTYLTLRNGWDKGPRFMQTHREELRQVTRQPREEAANHIAFAPGITALFGSGDDAGAWAVQAGAHEDVPVPAADGGGGQFWLVARGALDMAGHDDPWCLFVPPGEPAPRLRAGNDGADVLVLQFRKLRGDAA